MPELDTFSMADVHVLRFRFGPATARRPGQCDHDCDTRGCQNGCVLEMYHDHGNPEPHQCLKCLAGEEETMADLRHAEAVEMDDHDSEQMGDLKSAVLKRCFTPRTKQQRAETRCREAKERQRQRDIRALVSEAQQQFDELMDLIVAQNSVSPCGPWLAIAAHGWRCSGLPWLPNQPKAMASHSPPWAGQVLVVQLRPLP